MFLKYLALLSILSAGAQVMADPFNASTKMAATVHKVQIGMTDHDKTRLIYDKRIASGYNLENELKYTLKVDWPYLYFTTAAKNYPESNVFTIKPAINKKICNISTKICSSEVTGTHFALFGDSIVEYRKTREDTVGIYYWME